MKLVTDDTRYYLRAYRFFKLGLLPNKASYLEESEKYITAMSILDNEYAKLEQRLIDEAKK